MSPLLACLLLASARPFPPVGTDPDLGDPQSDLASYQAYAAAFEAAKRKGDYAAGEKAIQSALRYGPGDEYLWRSLAWCQQNQGKWRESLQNARLNIERNGACGWSYLQMFESCMAAGDFTAASDVLRAAPSLRNPQDIDWEPRRQSFLNRVSAREYEVEISVLDAGHRERGKKRFLIPLDCDRQKVRVMSVSGAEQTPIVHDNGRDVMDLEVSPGVAVTLKLNLILEPILVGPRTIDGAQDDAGKPEYLGPFVHGGKRNVYDPQLPRLVAITKTLGAKTAADRVRNVLRWLQSNFRYEELNGDDLPLILDRRHGVCHHYCGLFSAMSRSLGIPTDILHVTVLWNVNQVGTTRRINEPGTGTMAHGQNEVWLGSVGWIPLDPQNAGSLGNYTNDVIVFARAGRGPQDDHWSYDSLQGRPMKVTYLRRIPRVSL